jgi:hypothetical protein
MFRERAMEQRRLLLHDGDLAAQRLLRGLRDILTVDQDAAAGGVVQPLHQLDECRLAGARAADETDALAGLDGDRKPVVERRVVSAIGTSRRRTRCRRQRP